MDSEFGSGQLIGGGRYRVVRQLGAGGMGSVFEADDLNLRRLVAVKVLHQSLAEHPEVSKRFVREAL